MKIVRILPLIFLSLLSSGCCSEAALPSHLSKDAIIAFGLGTVSLATVYGKHALHGTAFAGNYPIITSVGKNSLAAVRSVAALCSVVCAIASCYTGLIEVSSTKSKAKKHTLVDHCWARFYMALSLTPLGASAYLLYKNRCA